MKHNPQKLLITGGAGFIGCNFVHYWLRTYPNEKVIVLDALTYAGNRDNLSVFEGNPNFQFVQGNILNTSLVERLLEREQIDTIVHFAAESHVDRSIQNPDVFLKTNIEGTHSLLKAAKRIWLDRGCANHRFHHISTDEVYGSLKPNEPAFTEHHQYLPNSPYAASKASADLLVRSYHHTYGLKTTISNCSNNFGPFQFPEKLVPLVIVNCVKKRQLRIYGSGTQIRDWLYVEDHVKGIDLIIRKGVVGNTYNIGGGNEIRNIGIVNMICNYMDKYHPFGSPHKSLITYVKDRAGHDTRYAIDSCKMLNELGYMSKESMETAIPKTIMWYLNNTTWWYRIVNGSYRV
ncbi:MAG: dTDP-glucose 4,6-dehydratase [Gammaproteobacteria bacterium]|nr:dTDP-glucose 4,6-dehydratase [Gammaproteobacteria bacterium]